MLPEEKPMPGIEYASMSRRTERRGQINSLERQRLLFLTDRAIVIGLDGDEAAELAYLKYINGTGPEAPAVPVKDGGTDGTASTGARSGRDAQLATLAARWPHRRLTGRQALCVLEEQRMLWGMTAKQRALWRMKR
jgi:hypothetical protein